MNKVTEKDIGKHFSCTLYESKTKFIGKVYFNIKNFKPYNTFKL